MELKLQASTRVGFDPLALLWGLVCRSCFNVSFQDLLLYPHDGCILLLGPSNHTEHAGRQKGSTGVSAVRELDKRDTSRAATILFWLSA